MIDLFSIATEVKPLILEAGDIIRKAWEKKDFISHLKDERDIVTETDIEVEEYLRKNLYKILPQAGCIVEEGKTEMKGEFNWTVDPIDGTKFFAHGAPLFFTQVSLLQKGEPVLSFVYQPISNQMFSAIKNKGAFLNGIQISQPKSVSLESAIVEFDLGNLHSANNKWKFKVVEKLCSKIYRPRFSSGYLNPYLATGAVDATINADIVQPFSIKNKVDLYPHNLILEEAGFHKEIVKFETGNVLITSSKELLKKIVYLLFP